MSYWALIWQRMRAGSPCVCGQISSTAVEQHHSCWLEVDVQAKPHWSLFPAVLLLETECNFPSATTCGWISFTVWMPSHWALEYCIFCQAKFNAALCLPCFWYLLDCPRCCVLSFPIALHGNTGNVGPRPICFNTLWMFFCWYDFPFRNVRFILTVRSLGMPWLWCHCG